MDKPTLQVHYGATKIKKKKKKITRNLNNKAHRSSETSLGVEALVFPSRFVRIMLERTLNSWPNAWITIQIKTSKSTYCAVSETSPSPTSSISGAAAAGAGSATAGASEVIGSAGDVSVGDFKERREGDPSLQQFSNQFANKQKTESFTSWLPHSLSPSQSWQWHAYTLVN